MPKQNYIRNPTNKNLEAQNMEKEEIGSNAVTKFSRYETRNCVNVKYKG